MKKIIIISLVVIAALILLVYLLRRFNALPTMTALDKKLKFFRMDEFDSPAQATDTGEKYFKNGKQYLRGSGEVNMQMGFVKMLDKARKIIEDEWNANNPTQEIIFRVNSGYRTQGYNDSLSGSVPNSSHITGHAADISLKNYTDEQIGVVFNALNRVGFRRFGLGKTYVHVDNDASKNNAVWNYGAGSISIDPLTA